MKNLALVPMLLAGALALGAHTVHADDGPAIIIPDGICFIVNPATPAPFVIALRDAHITEAANPDGNFSMHCNGNIDPPFDETTVVVDGSVSGLRCVGTSAGGVVFDTTDWHGVITKSGRVNISCHFNSSS